MQLLLLIYGTPFQLSILSNELMSMIAQTNGLLQGEFHACGASAQCSMPCREDLFMFHLRHSDRHQTWQRAPTATTTLSTSAKGTVVSDSLARALGLPYDSSFSASLSPDSPSQPTRHASFIHFLLDSTVRPFSAKMCAYINAMCLASPLYVLQFGPPS